jgi:hypothetical protein
MKRSTHQAACQSAFLESRKGDYNAKQMNDLGSINSKAESVILDELSLEPHGLIR